MKKIALLFVLFAFVATTSFAQEADTETETPKKWDQGLGVGLDFAQLLQINPKVGAGENRIGFGGALTYFANMKQDKHAWDNSVSWKVGVQKLGAGRIAPDQKKPFQKNIDELRFDSKYGYAISSNKKWYAATEFSFLSQILKTYDGSLLNDQGTGIHEISKFLSPATITYSIGIDFKPSDKFSIYYSPVALKAIVVMDDSIAVRGLHGNPVYDDGTYKNTLSLAGSLLKAQYQDKYLAFGKDQHRIMFKTSVSFFYDYLQGQKKNDNPDYKTNIDVDWGTETTFVIWKGLSAVVSTNLFYDWDVPVQETDYDTVTGLSGNLVRRVSFTQQLLIKYTHNF